MAKAEVDNHDTSSDQSPSDKETHVEPGPVQDLDDLVPDPDDGLSEAERKAIVRPCVPSIRATSG
jgi:hypothetical protein